MLKCGGVRPDRRRVATDGEGQEAFGVMSLLEQRAQAPAFVLRGLDPSKSSEHTLASAAPKVAPRLLWTSFKFRSAEHGGRLFGVVNSPFQKTER